ncbi:T-cell immunoglobulin and mucin domain-containing protein 4-like [Athene cunicularia]|uniref:T-cell immunoglobulin and mucin domain-containing protein 4-like n=1 Tax=Athene cunicularia TaxID=194338 RepID=UPI000EF6400B|nr:T-cell immunoglobulin and mucin domain-containing protein 4-like [Athene cunicularia]
MSHFVLFHWTMIQIFIVHTASQAVVRGVIGKPVQLSCSYRVAQDKDISDMCWGRGPCPKSKCTNKILHTTGNRVTFRKSQRYSLRGNISSGDVSLTIGRVKAEDAGTYCCRIEIAGWFNDIKRNIQLEVRGEFGETANDSFPATIATTSALPDFSTGFQAADMRTEDDDMFCPSESVTLPGATTPPVPTMLQTPKRTLAPSGKGTSSDSNTKKHDDNGDKFPSYAILIACLIAVSIILILMVSLFWKRKHTKKFIIKSLGPAEDLEKVFSGAEGENSIFSL